MGKRRGGPRASGTVEVDGKTYAWSVDEHDIMDVHHAGEGPPFGVETTQVGGMDREGLARMLAAGLVAKWARDPRNPENEVG